MLAEPGRPRHALIVAAFPEFHEMDNNESLCVPVATVDGEHRFSACPPTVAETAARYDEIIKRRFSDKPLAEQMHQPQEAMKGIRIGQRSERKMQDKAPQQKLWKHFVLGG